MNLYWTLWIVAPLTLIFAAGCCVLRYRLRGRKAPFTKEKGLRWAGYSGEKRVDEIQERLMSALVMLAVVPIVSTLLVHMLDTPFVPKAVLVAVVGVAVVWCGRLGFCWLRGIYQLVNARLGMIGERIVGQAADELRKDGCLVFHDVPMGGFNIDHVLLGPKGVFALETKSLRKQRGQDGQHLYEITYDGQRLTAGTGRDYTKPLAQARRQTCQLSDWLSTGFSRRIDAVPVIVLPGWFVKADPANQTAEVKVCSHKLLSTLLRGRDKLSDAEIRQIAARLEDRCRDVDW